MSIYLPSGSRELNVKALVGAFNQDKALVGAFYVIVQLVVEPTIITTTPRSPCTSPSPLTSVSSSQPLCCPADSDKSRL